MIFPLFDQLSPADREAVLDVYADLVETKVRGRENRYYIPFAHEVRLEGEIEAIRMYIANRPEDRKVLLPGQKGSLIQSLREAEADIARQGRQTPAEWVAEQVNPPAYPSSGLRFRLEPLPADDGGDEH